MHLPGSEMLLTYLLLGIAILGVWLPDIRIGRDWRVAAWQPPFVAALAIGLAVGQLAWTAVLASAVLWAIAYAAVRARHAATAGALVALTIVLAFALSAHWLPGFLNPPLATNLQLSAESAPFTQRAKFDMGAAGLLLLAYFCRRVRHMSEWPSVLSTGVGVGTCTAVVVIGFALSVGFVTPDAKLPAYALVWAASNLLVICMLEEAFFRGFVQDRLATALRAYPRWRWAPVAVASVLFGVAHAGGGLTLVAAATLAGVGYGTAYALTQRIEAAVLAHFTLNSIHFFGFTYPHAVR
jgi:membrane protease YdiL (CAAX protease family)